MNIPKTIKDMESRIESFPCDFYSSAISANKQKIPGCEPGRLISVGAERYSWSRGRWRMQTGRVSPSAACLGVSQVQLLVET